VKPFRERNPVVIGVVGLAVIVLLILAAFRVDRLPLIGGGDTYHAEFAEIGSLRAGDEVRVAGVSVGEVTDVELQGDRVRVSFQMDDGTEFGPDTGAEIRVRTLLGAVFLALTPAGEGQLEAGATIPLERTLAPYDVVQAFSDLSRTADELDVDQISSALDTLAAVAADTPEEFKGAIQGVSDLSRNLADRDEQINTLLVGLKKVSGVLNSRNDQLESLFEDSSVLFEAISARRDAIHRLLVSTEQISDELSGLVDDTQADLAPALSQLDEVTTMLRENEASIDEALRVSPGFYRLFSNALGSGPWFDVFLGGVPPNLGVAQQLKDARGAGEKP